MSGGQSLPASRPGLVAVFVCVIGSWPRAHRDRDTMSGGIGDRICVFADMPVPKREKRKQCAFGRSRTARAIAKQHMGNSYQFTLGVFRAVRDWLRAKAADVRRTGHQHRHHQLPQVIGGE